MRRVFSFASSSVEDSKVNTTQPLSHSQTENIITHKKKKEKIRQKKDITTEKEVNNMEYIEERKKQNRKSYLQPPPQALKNYSGHPSHVKEKKSRLSKYVEPHDFLGSFSFEETIKEEEHGDEKIKKSKKKSNGLEKKMSRRNDNRRDNRNSTTLEVVDNDKFYVSISNNNNNSLTQGFLRESDDDDDDDDDLPLGIRLQQNRSVNSVNSINSINSANSLGSSNYHHNHNHHNHRPLSSASSFPFQENKHKIEELPKSKMSNKRHSGIPPLSPTPNPTIPTARMRNLSLNIVRPRTDSFTRSVPPPRRASDGAVLALAAVPPNEKDSKRMSTFEYHKYQQELIAAQYQRHGVNPLPVPDEQPIESPNPVRSSSLVPTLIQVSQEYKNNVSTMVEAINAQPNSPRRLNELNENARSKRLSVSRRIALAETNPTTSSGRLPENSLHYGDRRNNTETTITQQQLYLPRASQPQRNSTIVNLPSKFQHSATSLSSGSTNLSSSGGSGGPPTPKNKSSSSVTIMGEGGNYVGVGSGSGNSRSSTPSSIGSIGVGYVVEKKEREKRKKSILRIK